MNFRTYSRRFFATLVLASQAIAGVAFAVGLQVSPTSISIPATQQAGALWLSNTGDTLINAQVRVFHWVQADGKNELIPSEGLVVSPPMLRLEPNANQLIRVIRTGAPPAGATAVEDAYRLIINELPNPQVPTQTPSQTGNRQITFLLQYSLPVFIEPLGLPQNGEPHYQLHWSMSRQNNTVTFTVQNTGKQNAQIADINFFPATAQKAPKAADSSTGISIAKGLVGYVLPNQTLHFEFHLPAGTPALTNGTWRVLLNGIEQPQTIAIAPK